MILGIAVAGLLVLLVTVVLALRAEHSGFWLLALVGAPTANFGVGLYVGGALIESYIGIAAVAAGCVAAEGIGYRSLLHRRHDPAADGRSGLATIGTLGLTAVLAAPLYSASSSSCASS